MLKLLKDKFLFIVKILNSYLISENGVKLQMDDDLFDCMWNAIKENKQPDFNRMKKNATNERLNAKYKEEGYFKKYYKNNDGCYECERCGKKISSKTNKAKHQNTSRCQEIYEENKQKELQDKIVKKVLLWN